MIIFAQLPISPIRVNIIETFTSLAFGCLSPLAKTFALLLPNGIALANLQL